MDVLNACITLIFDTLVPALLLYILNLWALSVLLASPVGSRFSLGEMVPFTLLFISTGLFLVSLALVAVRLVELGTYGLNRRLLCWLPLILLADTVGGFIRFDWNCSGLLGGATLGDVVDFCGACSEAVGGLMDTFGLGRPDFRLVLDSLEIDFRMSDLLVDCFFWFDDETDVEELREERDDDS